MRRLIALAGLTAAGAVAACGDDAETSLAGVETSPAVEVVGVDMAFEPPDVAVEAGEVEVILHNEGSVLHDLRIDDEPFILEALPGETDRATVALDPGSYRLWCSLPGHAEAGMEGRLEVR